VLVVVAACGSSTAAHAQEDPGRSGMDESRGLLQRLRSPRRRGCQPDQSRQRLLGNALFFTRPDDSFHYLEDTGAKRDLGVTTTEFAIGENLDSRI
jgi:hypothetical protein